MTGEGKGTRCVVGAVRAVSGDQWIGADADRRDVWWAEARRTFAAHVPANLLEWIAEPVEETVYDEQGRIVRLVVEGVALVPDVPGHPVGPAS